MARYLISFKLNMNLRSKEPIPDKNPVDAFFLRKPTADERLDLTEVCQSHIHEMDRRGLDYSDPEIRKESVWKLASRLKREELDGWVGLEPYHMKTNNYKMIKSL